MSFLDHIQRCNNFNPQHYVPFIIDSQQVGWTSKNFVKKLEPFSDVFNVNDDELQISKNLDTFEKRNHEVALVLKELHQVGIIDTWVDELYAVNQHYEEKPKMLMERAAVSYFGIRGYGVHVNGLVKTAKGVSIWIAKRAMDKPFWSGKLDQMVAGGQPAGISRRQNVIKESKEEAAIPEGLASKAEFVSEIHYRGESLENTRRGLNVDTLFNYDLWLPETFTPKNTDGEVEEFTLMSLPEMASIVDNSSDFKDNCNLVNIDLLIRRGLIDENHPDYAEIHRQLYAPAIT